MNERSALARGLAAAPDFRFLVGESWPIALRLVDRSGAPRDLAGLTFAGALYARDRLAVVETFAPLSQDRGIVRFLVPPGLTATVRPDPLPVDFWPTRLNLTRGQSATGAIGEERIIGLVTIAVGDPRTACWAPIAGEQIVDVIC